MPFCQGKSEGDHLKNETIPYLDTCIILTQLTQGLFKEAYKEKGAKAKAIQGSQAASSLGMSNVSKSLQGWLKRIFKKLMACKYWTEAWLTVKNKTKQNFVTKNNFLRIL